MLSMIGCRGVAKRAKKVALRLNVSPGSTSSQKTGTRYPELKVVLRPEERSKEDRGISALGTWLKEWLMTEGILAIDHLLSGVEEITDRSGPGEEGGDVGDVLADVIWQQDAKSIVVLTNAEQSEVDRVTADSGIRVLGEVHNKTDSLPMSVSKERRGIGEGFAIVE
jgi:hypothetical protein